MLFKLKYKKNLYIANERHGIEGFKKGEKGKREKISKQTEYKIGKELLILVIFFL